MVSSGTRLPRKRLLDGRPHREQLVRYDAPLLRLPEVADQTADGLEAIRVAGRGTNEVVELLSRRAHPATAATLTTVAVQRGSGTGSPCSRRLSTCSRIA